MHARSARRQQHRQHRDRRWPAHTMRSECVIYQREAELLGKGLQPYEPTQGSLRPASWPLTEIKAAPLKTNAIS